MPKFIMPDTPDGAGYVSKYMHQGMHFSGFFSSIETPELWTLVRPGPHGWSPTVWAFEGENLAYDAETDTYSGTVTKVSLEPATAGDGYYEFHATELALSFEELMKDPEFLMALLTEGADEVTGSKGDDTIEPGADNDKVWARDGDDYVFAGKGNDLVFGGKGDDELFGGNGHDKLKGGSGDDELFGENGNDKLWGNRGDDYLNGGAGKDKLKGGSGDDYLEGGGGRDLLKGGGGHDFLNGGAGRDKFIGGKGNDTFLTGGGRDVLKFNKHQGTDTVLDFKPGKDKIDLRGTGMDIWDLQAAASKVPGGVLIDLGRGEVLLEGVKLGQLDEHDFIL